MGQRIAFGASIEDFDGLKSPSPVHLNAYASCMVPNVVSLGCAAAHSGSIADVERGDENHSV